MLLSINQPTYFFAGFFLLCLFLLSPACIDPISLKTDTTEKTLVIDGLFSASRQHLTLSYTRNFTTSITEFISDAQVSLHDDNGFLASYTPAGAGTYLLKEEALKAEAGKAYHIEISLMNGKNYKTIPQILPKSIPPKALNWEVEKEIVSSPINRPVENFFINLYIDTETRIDNEGAYLRWLTEEVYSFQDESCHQLDPKINCYIYLPSTQEIVILNGQDLKEGLIENIPVYSKKLIPRSPEFEQKHAFNVYQLSITREAFAYWENVLQLTNQSGSIFDRPPAALRGNVYNVEEEQELVLGFFEVAAIDTIRVFTRPPDFKGKYIFITYCTDRFRERYTPDCCNCLLIEGSTLTAPAYW